jgi:hypothetical protein
VIFRLEDLYLRASRYVFAGRLSHSCLTLVDPKLS